jgi:hypothetical protein
MWSSWPLRVTKEDLLDMGVDVDKGQQVSIEAVLARYEPEEEVESGDGLSVFTSLLRRKLNAVLLGVSPAALDESLPHLDAGDSSSMCNDDAPSSDPDQISARESLVNVLSGRHVLASRRSAGHEYGPWSTRYCGHQFGVWAGQLGDGRAISLLETEVPGGGRQEIQLKGAGRTPFSRHADGLAVLRSGVREFVGCEGASIVERC